MIEVLNQQDHLSLHTIAAEKQSFKRPSISVKRSKKSSLSSNERKQELSVSCKRAC